jgi:hypothetical protein
MHPLRKLRESGKYTVAQMRELLAENAVFNSPLLIRPIEGGDVLAAIFAQSSSDAWVGYLNGRVQARRANHLLALGGNHGRPQNREHGVIVDNEQGLIVERTIAMRPVSGGETVSAMPCMQHSRISCRRMFGTIQRHSVEVIYENQFDQVFSEGDK